MIDHFTDNNGVSYHRRAEFGFCLVEDKAFEKYQKQQANDFIERLKRRNESRKRRGVHVVSEREAIKRAARYREALRLEMDLAITLSGRCTFQTIVIWRWNLTTNLETGE